MIEVCDLSPSDLPAYVGLFQRAFAEPPWNETWSEAAVRRDFARLRWLPGSFARVAMAEGAARGAITGGRLPVIGGFYLAQLFVDPQWQGRGIGRRLMTDALETLGREGRWAVLRTRADSSAEAIYRRHGFRRITWVPRLKGDVLLMRPVGRT